MTAVAKRAHYSLHLIDGKPVVLCWRKVIGAKKGEDHLDKRWTVLEEVPPKTRAQFEEALADWSALGGGT